MPHPSRARSHKRRFRYTAATPDSKIVVEPKEKKGPLGEILQPGKVFFRFNPRSDRDWLFAYYRNLMSRAMDNVKPAKESPFPGYNPHFMVFDSVERLDESLPQAREAEEGMSSAGQRQDSGTWSPEADGAREDAPAGDGRGEAPRGGGRPPSSD